MTTIHPPAQGIPWKGGTQTWAGRMHRLATLPVVPRELKPFQVRLDGPGNAVTRLGGAQWRYGVRRRRVRNP